MATIVNGALSGAATAAAAPGKLLSGLSHLAFIEGQEADRDRLSDVNWWTDVFRLRASAIRKVWMSVGVVTLFSAVVAAASITYGQSLGLTNNVVPLLSVVVGLLLVFRTNTSFARWEEGRRTFTAMTSTIRSTSRFVWINVGLQTFDAERDSFQHAKWTAQDQREKRIFLRVLCAFPVAVMHHVRGEFGTEYDDLRDLLPPNFAAVARKANRPLGAELKSADTRLPIPDFSRRNSAPPTAQDTVQSQAESIVFLENEFARPSVPLPLTIAHYAQLVLAKWRAKGLLDLTGPAGYNALSTQINTLIAEFGATERLGTMAIPAIYGIHLKQVVSLFLLLLPFTLVDTLSWKMIPFVTCYAFILQGIEGIATEIEQPFGRQPSDLPLDLITAELRNEIEHLMTDLPDDPTVVDELFGAPTS